MHTRYGRVHNSAQPDGWLLLIYLRDAFVTREYPFLCSAGAAAPFLTALNFRRYVRTTEIR